MKNIKNVIIQSFVLALLVSTTALAAWKEYPINRFLNREQRCRLFLINLVNDGEPTNAGFHFSIHADSASFEALQSHVSQWGFSFQKDELSRIIHIDLPWSEAERAHHFLDILNTFEAIQPQQVLAQMRAVLDSQLASSIHRQQQPAVRSARNRRASPQFDVFARETLGAYPLPVNLRFGRVALGIPLALEEAKAPEVQLTPAQYQNVSRKDLSDTEVDVSCAICQSSYSEIEDNKAELVRVHCLGHAGQPGHLFCKSCIHQSYQHKRTCPSCRGQIVEAENIVVEGEPPFLFNQSAAVRLNLDMAKITTLAAKSFCAARGKKLVGFKTREFAHVLPMRAYMGNNRQPIEVVALAAGDAPHIEFSELWCTKETKMPRYSYSL